MFTVQRDSSKLNIVLSTDRSLMGRLDLEVDEFLSQFAEANYTKLKVVLRELLSNAIDHGNNHRPELQVRCEIDHLEHRLFRITVEDEGEGFDPHAVDMELPPDPKYAKTHGYILINAFSDDLQFSDTANKISVDVTCPSIQQEQVMTLVDTANSDRRALGNSLRAADVERK